MDNVRVIFMDMPVKMKGYTILKDDFYTIVLNSKCSTEQNRLSYYHELWHIKNGDCEKKCSVDLIEFNAHNIV